MNYQTLINKCLINEDALSSYPFEKTKYQDITVMRHSSNNKWFALIFYLENKLCINLKCPPDIIPILKDQYPAIKPAWHMNKKHWCTIFVNDITQEVLDELIKISFQITAPKQKQKH